MRKIKIVFIDECTRISEPTIEDMKRAISDQIVKVYTNAHNEWMNEYAISGNGVDDKQMKSTLEDMTLVWAWDKSDLTRELVFFDKVSTIKDGSGNYTCFASNGERNGYAYDKVKPYKGKYPKWARKALKSLRRLNRI